MIDFEKAKKAFDEYVKEFDRTDSRIDRKIRHTYLVVEASEYLGKALNLNKEDYELSRLIALLHDIGRFKQSEVEAKNYDEAELKFDHGEYGAKILFENNLIRNFIENDKYDEIIRKAIINHNKIKIEENLNERELLHAKLIRDNDKTGNFTLKYKEDLKTVYNLEDISVLENEEISDDVYESFKNEEVIKKKDRKTDLDRWLALAAFIFDYNFKESIKFIYENKYIDKIIDRINYKNVKTIEKIKNIKIIINNYIANNI